MAYNPNTPQTPAAALRTIKIIHLALAAGQILFAVTVILINKRININLRDPHDPLVYAVPALAVVCFFLSNFLFKNILGSTLKPESGLMQKLGAYQTASIVRLALLEGPSLFGIVAFFFTGAIYFLLISGLLVAWFIYLRPTTDSIGEALELDYKEKELLSGSGGFPV